MASGVTAQALCSPSYVSAEYALQYYGLLLERVTTITSVTILKSCKFKTPVGNFTFDHIQKKRYPIGYEIVENSFFIARPEKALLDYLNLRIKNISWSSNADIQEFLDEDLRLKTNKLVSLIRLSDCKELLSCYHRNSKEARMLKYLIYLKKGL